MSINCGQLLQAKRMGNEEQDWNGEAAASAFVGQAVGIPNLIVVASLSTAYCPIHN
ncbi:hypothetical protein [Paenibacillus sp. GXUN7292]|uniref:hypothetical protein n=1 Tax=Paenibacillus sp. GXUN7292 TaxID=3422499 RepID=UPI003D7C4EF8